MLFLLVLIAPMIYYVVATNRSSQGAIMTTARRQHSGRGQSGGATAARRERAGCGPRRNPWRHPWFLEGFTWLYLVWSLVPDRDRGAVLVQQRTSRRASGRASPGAGTSPTR